MQYLIYKAQIVSFCRVMALLALVLTLASCVNSSLISQKPPSRYTLENDVGTLEPIDLSSVKPVIPKIEPRTRAGNKNPYTVNGVTYHLMESDVGYTEMGLASWYGRKFHGHLTSNGEIYDMFELTAAHKTIPIPGYLKVTNLDNDKSVVVRVNDRGPFHEGRVVDLSYAAASMLDYADKGTARVKVEAIIPGISTISETSVEPSSLVPIEVDSQLIAANGAGTQLEESITDVSLESIALERQKIEEGIGGDFLQLGAFSNLQSAKSLVMQVSNLTSLPVFIRTEATEGANKLLHRVRLGPLNETIELNTLIQLIIDNNLGTPFKVRQ